MVHYASISDLRGSATVINEVQILKEALNISDKTVFLSHSSKDHDRLPLVISILEKHGGRVYIDDYDRGLSGSNYVRTAEILRRTVQICHKFVLFVTARSNESKWIPWELGLGDGNKKADCVALFPSEDNYLVQKWPDREYLGLYQQIVVDTSSYRPEWFVYDRNTSKQTPLRDWLTK